MATQKRKGRAENIDVTIGKRIRKRREHNGISQERLGKKIGVSFQQVQKYETGANRLPLSNLVKISEITDTPIAWFFVDILPDRLIAKSVAKNMLATKDLLHLEWLHNASPEQRSSIRIITEGLGSAYKHKSVNDNGGGDDTTS